MKKSLFVLFLLVLLSGQNLSVANNYGLADNIQDGTILHCFNWTYNQIKAELPGIAKAGFTSVQTSPAQNAGSGEWYWLYQPSDFVCDGNSLGSRNDLQSLCSEAKKYGIKIISDVVANHLNGSLSYVAVRWHDSKYWHDFNGTIHYDNRWEITHGKVGGVNDLNSENATVQNAVRTYIMDLKNLGVEGIRWDAAKHIALPSEGCGFWSTVTNGSGLWHYGEILIGPADSGNEGLMKEYTKYVSVTDNTYGTDMRNNIQGGHVTESYANWGARGIADNKIVYWAESHDTYSNNDDYGDSRGATENQIDRTWALIASRNGATALYFSRPPNKSKKEIKSGQKGSTHFTSKEVAAVNHFHNAMIGQPDYYVSGNGAMAVCRTKGAVVVKASGSGSVSISNGGKTVVPGTYKDEITGNPWTVTSSTISGSVGSSGIAVIYDYENAIKQDAAVTFSPDGGAFRTPELTVTATLTNATSGWYKAGDGNKVSFTGTRNFSIGENMDYGESLTVSWGASGETGEKTGSVIFTKVDPDAKVYVYYNNPNTWGSVNAYIYNGSADPKIENGAWPGKPMAFDANMVIKEIKGWWIYEVPQNLWNGSNVIFNGGANGSQYPGSMEPGLGLSGVSMVLNGTTWELMEQTVTQNIKIPGVYFSAVNSTNKVEVSVSAENKNAGNLTYSYTINGSPAQVSGAYCSFYPQNGENTLYITATDGSDSAKKTVTYVAGSKTPDIDAGSKMYIVGTVNKWGSGSDDPITAGADGVYTAEIDWGAKSGETDGCYYFRIYPSIRSGWDSQSYAPASSGAEKVNLKIEADKDYPATLFGTGTENCWVAEPGKYTLTFNGTTLRLSTQSAPVITDPVEFKATVMDDKVELTVTGNRTSPVYRAVTVQSNGMETTTAGTISGSIWNGAKEDKYKTVRFYADVDGYTLARNIEYEGTGDVDNITAAGQDIVIAGNTLIVGNCENTDITVANTLGQIVYSKAGVTGDIAMELVKGIYIIKVSDTVKRIIVN